MHFGIPTGVYNDTKWYPSTPLAMLVFDTAAHTILCQMFDRSLRTMRAIAPYFKNDFDGPAQFQLVLRFNRYVGLTMARHHFCFWYGTFFLQAICISRSGA